MFFGVAGWKTEEIGQMNFSGDVSMKLSEGNCERNFPANFSEVELRPFPVPVFVCLCLVFVVQGAVKC